MSNQDTMAYAPDTATPDAATNGGRQPQEITICQRKLARMEERIAALTAERDTLKRALDALIVAHAQAQAIRRGAKRA